MNFKKYLEHLNLTNVPTALLIETHQEDTYELSLIFLKTMLCNKNKNYFCNECQICKKINENNYLDFIYLNSFENKLTREKIEVLKNYFNTNCFEKNNFKLYVITEIDSASKEVLNALLKFIEDNNSNCHCLFFCRNINAVIDTIASRCEKLILVDSKISQGNLSDLEFFAIKIFDDTFIIKNYFENHNFEKQYNLTKKFVENIKKSENQINFLNLIKESSIFEIKIILKILIELKLQKSFELNELIFDLKLNLNKTLLFFKIMEILGVN